MVTESDAGSQPSEPGGGAPMIFRSGGSSRRSWAASYRACLVLLDLVIASVAMAVGVALRFRVETMIVGLDFLSYYLFAPLAVLVWLILLATTGAYDSRIVGVGLEEYRKVINASFVLFSGLALLSYCLKLEVSRSLFLTSLPIGIILLVTGRWAARQALRGKRKKGRCLTPTLLVGHASEVAAMLKRIRVQSWEGYQPVGVCVIPGGPLVDLQELSVRGQPLADVDYNDMPSQIVARTYGAVIVAGGLSSKQIKTLSWQLEDIDLDFLVNPSVTDVAGPRMTMRSAEGLSLIHIDLPEFSGWKILYKRLFDVVFSSVFLLVFWWLFAIIAIVIKLGDGGPALFRQERVGLRGETFFMHKFRTMCVDAESRLAQLKEAKKHKDGELFKMEDDPRITKPGKLLRKWSLDELPQFWDVLMGKMSVVGPRPALPSEVASYDSHQNRRLLVKPGITGLWQVSGRSDLSIDEYFRLDLLYVENWSPITDVLIILRTVGVVLDHRGAY